MRSIVTLRPIKAGLLLVLSAALAWGGCGGGGGGGPIGGTGIVTGGVTLGGVPSVGAIVFFADQHTATTNQSARFTLYNVPAGDQILTATNFGHSVVGYKNVLVPAVGTVDAGIINMQSGPPPPPVL